MRKEQKSGTWTFVAETEDRLEILARALAPDLRVADFIALRGDLGAGKTAFARVLIRILSGQNALEVPSPTFSLVQNYETSKGPLVHFDLYRLKSPLELDELGWEDALEDAITLVEWPDRAADLPADRFDFEFKPVAETEVREILVTGHGALAARLDRMRETNAFLTACGWQTAARVHLHGDASSRFYQRLTKGEASAILMNSPARADGPVVRDGRTYSEIAKLAENIRPFVAIAEGLAEHGFHSPEIIASDLDKGLILLENFGSETIVSKNPSAPLADRYDAALDVLTEMHRKKWPNVIHPQNGPAYQLPVYDEEALLIETELVLDWFAPAAASITDSSEMERDAKDAFLEIWRSLISYLDISRRVWVLRDFHSPNLHWLEKETGLDRIGLIDFQDAVLGHPAYDTVSLLQDARVDITPDLEAHLYRRYIERMKAFAEFDEVEFARAYAILGAQRNCKILGIFVRLARRDKKPGYLRHLPRISAYLARDLEHPALAELKSWFLVNLPEALNPPQQLVGGGEGQ